MKKIYKNLEIEMYFFSVEVMLASNDVLDQKDNFGSVNDFN